MTTKNFTTILALALALTLILTAAVASADVVTFTDTSTHWDGWGTWQENGKDTIGIPDFTGGSATFSVSSGVGNLTGVEFNLVANNYESAYNSLTSGDLFLNTNNDTSWDYVVRLNDDLTADVFAVNLAYTDPNGYTLGSANGDYRDNHPAWADLSGMTAVGSASWSGLPEYVSGTGAYGSVSITGLDVDFTTLSLSYTVSCANDVVMASSIASTPIPGAVWLLGSGLMSLLGLRRRLVRA